MGRGAERCLCLCMRACACDDARSIDNSSSTPTSTSSDLPADGASNFLSGAFVIVRSAQRQQQHALSLPRRGATPTPMLADDGTVEILHAYSVPGPAPSCLPWPTGRGNPLRSGLIL